MRVCIKLKDAYVNDHNIEFGARIRQVATLVWYG